MATTHGMNGTPTYRCWNGMKQRCDNPNNKRYSDYGGRGIRYCKRWAKFENFLKDMGKKPKGRTLDRADNDGNYEPLNCRWATASEQMNNRRNNRNITFNGKTKTLTQWAKEIGVLPTVLDTRLRRGWTLERAMTESSEEKKHDYRGLSKTITEWAEHLKIDRNAIYTRLHRGWSLEKALSTPVQKNIIITANGETKTAGEWRELLNIPKSTFHNRLKRGWTEEEALFGKTYAGGCG